jgi:hypothetical protein
MPGFQAMGRERRPAMSLQQAKRIADQLRIQAPSGVDALSLAWVKLTEAERTMIAKTVERARLAGQTFNVKAAVRALTRKR